MSWPGDGLYEMLRAVAVQNHVKLVNINMCRTWMCILNSMAICFAMILDVDPYLVDFPLPSNYVPKRVRYASRLNLQTFPGNQGEHLPTRSENQHGAKQAQYPLNNSSNWNPIFSGSRLKFERSKLTAQTKNTRSLV